jgi:hypothetical protein
MTLHYTRGIDNGHVTTATCCGSNKTDTIDKQRFSSVGFLDVTKFRLRLLSHK